jgi:hypothetical protein
MESYITGSVCLAMLKEFHIPQLDADIVIFRQDGAPPHYRDGTSFLNETFPQRLIGRGGHIAWPPRSPDLTPLDLCIGGFVKEKVYVLPMPHNVQQLKERIRGAHVLVDEEFLAKMWQELEF